jgi:hypothetical protein
MYLHRFNAVTTVGHAATVETIWLIDGGLNYTAAGVGTGQIPTKLTTTYLCDKRLICRCYKCITATPKRYILSANR